MVKLSAMAKLTCDACDTLPLFFISEGISHLCDDGLASLSLFAESQHLHHQLPCSRILSPFVASCLSCSNALPKVCKHPCYPVQILVILFLHRCTILVCQCSSKGNWELFIEWYLLRHFVIKHHVVLIKLRTYTLDLHLPLYSGYFVDWQPVYISNHFDY